MGRPVVVNGRELNMNDAGFIDHNSEWSVIVGEDGSVEVNRLDLKAENERLREQGARLFDKTLELGTENAKLRELVRDMWEGMCGYGHDCRGCEHYELHDGQRFVGECEYHRRMRELGVEVEHE